MWDVYAACEREGSLDSRIRNPLVNDFSELKRLCPGLEAIAHNGSESFKHARQVHAALLGTATAMRPPGGSEVHAVTSVGANEVRSAGPPQVSTAPSGGSEAHAVASVGANEVRSAGPPQASTAPLGGSEVHAVTSVGVQFYKLPSTSPANAAWSFERKLAAWREVFEKQRLTD